MQSPDVPGQLLCPRCSDFQSTLHYYFEGDHPGRTLVFRLHQSRRQLDSSASTGCTLCGLFAEALDHGDAKLEPNKRKQQDVNDDVEGAGLLMEDDGPVSVTVHDLQAILGNGIGMFAVESNTMTADLWSEVTNASVMPDWAVGTQDSGAGSDQAFSTARKWLANCKASHRQCQTSSPGSEPSSRPEGLPTRLLYVGGAQQSSPKLVEGLNKLPPFASLSYCWGPLSAGWLRTTKVNLDEHSGNKKARTGIHMD